jgi:hypothetical protein
MVSLDLVLVLTPGPLKKAAGFFLNREIFSKKRTATTFFSGWKKEDGGNAESKQIEKAAKRNGANEKGKRKDGQATGQGTEKRGNGYERSARSVRRG